MEKILAYLKDNEWFLGTNSDGSIWASDFCYSDINIELIDKEHHKYRVVITWAYKEKSYIKLCNSANEVMDFISKNEYVINSVGKSLRFS